MANVRPKKTGLNMVIFVSPKIGVPHGPRIKVPTKYGEKLPLDVGFFSVTIGDEPEVIGGTGDIRARDVQQAMAFVKENKDVLLALWEMDIYPDEAEYVAVP